MARKRSDITTETEPAGDKRRRRRLSVYLNDDGTPDLETIPAELKGALGMEDGAQPGEPEPDRVNPDLVKFLIVTLSRIEGFVIAKQNDMDVEAVCSALEPPAPLLAPMSETGARLLAKYAGGMNRWQDEIVLGSLLITWQSGAFQQIRALKASTVEPAANEPAAPEPPQTSPFPGALPFAVPQTGAAKPAPAPGDDSFVSEFEGV
jgi:hypothetical protein